MNNEIKSQDELSEGKRSSDVLISAVDKCRKLEHEIDLYKTANWELQTQVQTLGHQLKLKNMNIKRLRGQAPFIKEALHFAEEYKSLRGILRADQYIKIIDDVIDN